MWWSDQCYFTVWYTVISSRTRLRGNSYLAFCAVVRDAAQKPACVNTVIGLRAIGSIKGKAFFNQVMTTAESSLQSAPTPSLRSYSLQTARSVHYPHEEFDMKSDRSSVVMWLWLWTVHATWMCLLSYSNSSTSRQDCGANYSLFHTSLTLHKIGTLEERKGL